MLLGGLFLSSSLFYCYTVSPVYQGDRLRSEAACFSDALIFLGTIADKYACGIVLPLVANYDEYLLEILAPVHLKDAMGLKDGDEVTLELSL